MYALVKEPLEKQPSVCSFCGVYEDLKMIAESIEEEELRAMAEQEAPADSWPGGIADRSQR